MNVVHLIVREAIHRKVNAFLSLIGVTLAVSLYAFFFTVGEASKRETTRLMRDMGFNVRVIPGGTSMDQFWLNGFSDQTMPESFVQRLGESAGISYAHLVATLQKRAMIDGTEVILMGLAPEFSNGKNAEQAMSFEIEKGTAYIGFEVARRTGWRIDDEVLVAGRPFRVAKSLPESGTDDDIRIYGSLLDVQEALGLSGQINEIKALQCLCLQPGRDTLEELREQLVRALPGTQVLLIQNIAESRKQQRVMAERYFGILMPVVWGLAAAWIGILAAVNVRERRSEMGILRALGYGAPRLAILFLGKAILLGLVGACLGFAAGTWAALHLGPEAFKLTARGMAPEYRVLIICLGVAPGVSALASFIPAMLAASQDPAEVLRQE